MKKFFCVSGAAVLFWLLGGCSFEKTQQVQSVDTAMGTVVQQSIYTREADSGAARDILELTKSLEQEMLSRRLDSSQVYAVNAGAGKPEGTEVSEELAQILRTCIRIGEDSGGALDITLGPVVQLWDMDAWAAGERTGEFQPPGEEALTEALGLCGRDKMQLWEDSGESSQGNGGEAEDHVDASVGGRVILSAGACLDLGAVGKGVALDRILVYLEEHKEILGAVISLGGSILTYGEKPEGGGWRVAVMDPFDTSAYVGILTLDGGWCVSTSGDYQRFVEAEGVRYHHIYDPSSGYPAQSGVAGVTILSHSGLESGALSTACFILGVEAGLELAERYGAEALFVEKDGRVTMTAGMEQYWSPVGERIPE